MLELDRERADATKCSTQDFVSHLEVQRMIVFEIGKPSSQCKDLVLAVVVKNTLIEAPENVYEAAKGGLKTPLFSLAVEVIVDIIR